MGTITVNNVVNLLFPTVRASMKYYKIHGERQHKSLNNTSIHSKVKVHPVIHPRSLYQAIVLVETTIASPYLLEVATYVEDTAILPTVGVVNVRFALTSSSMKDVKMAD